MPYERNYKQEYQYQKTKKQKQNRAMRNAARNALKKKGIVKKGDGKDVDHKVPLCKGGSNNPSNLRVTSASKNRSFSRDSKARMK